MQALILDLENADTIKQSRDLVGISGPILNGILKNEKLLSANGALFMQCFLKNNKTSFDF